MATFADIQQEIANIMEYDPADLSEEQSANWYAYLDELKGARAEKIDAFASFLRLQDKRAKGIAEEIQELTKRKRAVENKVASLKAYYMGVMNEAQLDKVEGAVHKVSIRKSKSVSVSDYALDHLPDNLKKVTVEPRKTEIKKMLESGAELIGCEIVENQSLNIR